jgi:hypothetical protein
VRVAKLLHLAEAPEREIGAEPHPPLGHPS